MVLGTTALLLSLAGGPGQKPPEITLALEGRAFVLRSGTKVDREPLDRREPPAEKRGLDRVVFRKDDAYAVWDSRGLTVRRGAWAYTTRMWEVAVTPKLFTEEQILYNRICFKFGLRSPVATRLSGAMRIGNDVFFLAQWIEMDGRPWLEALVKVSLTEPNPKPALVGRFEGFAVHDSPASGALFPIDRKPCAVTQKEDGGWGRAMADPETKVFSWKPLGERLGKLIYTTPTQGCFIERTSYGTRLVGRFDLVAAEREDLMETRGEVGLLDSRKPWLALAKEERGVWLHNLSTGAKLRVPDKAAMRRVAFGLLVWSPAGKPEFAELLEIDRLQKLAAWAAKPADVSGRGR